MPNPNPSKSNWRRDWLDRAAITCVCALVVATYFWTVRAPTYPLALNSEGGDYYNRLVEGFRRGHLYLAVDLPPLPDPSWPKEKLPPGFPSYLDASYYNGHYYLYFGAAPALLVLWPYRALTGHFLNLPVAVGFLASLGFCFAAAILVRLRRFVFPEGSRLSLVTGLVLLGFANAVLPTIRKPNFYEFATIGSYAFSMAMLYCLLRACLSQGRHLLWLALASLAAGLAVNSRVNIVVGAALALPFASVLLWRSRSHGPTIRGLVSHLLAGGLPVLSLLGALLVYNRARFGAFMEFGHEYQQGSNAEGFVSAAYFWHNLRLYYLTAPQLDWYFPFVATVPESFKPAHYIGREDVHGEWICLVALAIGAWVALACARERLLRKETRLVLGAAILWFALNLAVLCSIGSRANRYMLDFHPMLVVVVAILVAAVPARRGPSAAFGRWACLLAALAASAYNLGASLQTQRLFRENDPGAYARLAGMANRVTWPLQRIVGKTPGVQVFDITFRDSPPGTLQELMALGSTSEQDIWYLFLEGLGRGHLLVQHGEFGITAGTSFDLKPGVPRTLRLASGNFYPEPGHPFYGNLPLDLQWRAKTRAFATLDGETVLDRDIPLFTASVRDGELGRVLGPYRIGADFAGSIRWRGSEREDLARIAPRATLQGMTRLSVQFPSDRWGLAEPLVTTGTRSRNDMIDVVFVSPGSVQFRWLHDQRPVASSAVVPVDYAASHECTLHLGPRDAQGIRSVLFIVDGRIVIRATGGWNEASPYQMYYGCHPWYGLTERWMFGGLVAAEPVPGVGLPALAAALAQGGTVRLHLDFSDPPLSVSEPLMTTGVIGAADGLFLVRSGSGDVQLGVDHWGQAVVERSAQIPLDPNAVHVLELAVGAAMPGEHGVPLFVRLDHRRVIPGRIMLKYWDPRNVALLANPVGMSTSVAAFRDMLLWGETVPGSPEQLCAPEGRSIGLLFRADAGAAGRCEPLLSSGITGAGDGLVIRFLGDGNAQLGLDHWGVEVVWSERFPFDADGWHTLDADFGSMTGTPGRLRAVVDGRLIFAPPGSLHPADRSSLRIGRNDIGLSSCSARFGGAISP